MHTHAMMFIQDMAIMMLVAGLTTVLCHRFKQPIVLGYILAGIIVGPYTPPFSLVSDEMTIRTLGEVGVIFLMFSLGLEFNIHKLSKVGGAAFVAATLEIVFMIFLGYEIGHLFGWSDSNALFLGALLSISSTTIIVKALSELKMNNEKFAHLIFGILIIEDIFAILILALLSSIAITGSLQASEIVFTTAKLSSFLVVSMMVGILAVPKLLTYIAKFKSNEMLLISVLGLCFGFCLLVAKLNYSVALGAFLIGAIIAESKQLAKIEHLVTPLRDMFSAIFFVSVGLLFDPIVLKHYWPIIIAVTIAVVFGKVISSSLGMLLSGKDGKTSMRVGMGLAQIGEFSFIIAALGISLKVTGDFLYSIAVCVSIITTLFTPYLIKYSDVVTRFFSRFIPTSVSTFFTVYSEWMQNFHPEKDHAIIAKAIKRGLFHVLINLCVVVAIFLSGAYFDDAQFVAMFINVTNEYLQKTIIWAAALILSLPFLIASYRKIKALSMMLAEIKVMQTVDSKLPVDVHKIISEFIPIVSIFVMLIFVSFLSASILPPVELLLAVLVIVALLAIVFFRWFVKVHALLQVNLLEALKTTEKDKNNNNIPKGD